MSATFLVTNDGSVPALRVLPHVQRLAASCAGRLVVVRVIDPLLETRGMPREDVDAAVARLGEAWRTRLGDELAVHQVEAEVCVEAARPGERLHEAIIRLAGVHGAAALAMHSRGAGALRHALLGSAALGVLGNAGLPLMVTGEHACAAPPPGDPYHLLVTSDGSPASNAILAALARLLGNMRARVTLLHVSELRSGRPDPLGELEAAGRQLEWLRASLLTGAEILCVPARCYEPVPDAIVRMATSLGVHAIALSTRGYSINGRPDGRSTALDILRQSPLPLILARAGD